MADHSDMTPAASAGRPVEHGSRAQWRRARNAITARAGIQLLAGLLLVAGIPVFATVRILDNYGLVNERDRADTALGLQLQSATEALYRKRDEAADRAADLSRSPALQRAFISGDRAAIQRLARRQPGVVMYLRGRRVAGTEPPVAMTQSVSLALDGKQVGRVVATVALDGSLGARLLQETPHAAGDRLLIIRGNTVLGTGRRIAVDGRTVSLGGERFRARKTQIPNAPGVSLLALRSEAAIAASLRPYQRRVHYAGIGSLALLLLIGLLFGRPILRSLGDFRRVASQAATDSLTGLANRRAFDEELVLEWRRSERIGDSLALILIDLDDFKSVNDKFGHGVGDEVLRRFGEVLTDGVRQVDLAARYGGEEFAVIAPDTDLESAVRLAERLRADLANAPFELPDGETIQVTASFGVAVKNGLARAEELVVAGDEALYDAKRAGKDRVAPESVLVVPEPEPTPTPAPPERRRRSPAKKTAAKRTASKTAKATAAKPGAQAPKRAPRSPGKRTGASGPAKRPAKKPARSRSAKPKASSRQSSNESRPTVSPAGKSARRSSASRTPGT